MFGMFSTALASNKEAATTSNTDINTSQIPSTSGGPGAAALHATGNKKLRIGDYKLNIELPIKNHKTAIAYIATGGTISAEGTTHSYKAGKRSASQLLGAIKTPHNVRIDATDAYAIDSKDIETKYWFALRKEVLEKIDKADSIVISHGSDTLALSAFFLSLTVPAEKLASKRIILTGSMKPANAPNPDGPKNLSDAFHLAKNNEISGVLCIMNGEIFSPPYFEKKHTTAVDAFKSINPKIIGRPSRSAPPMKHQPMPPAHTFDLDGISDLPIARVIQSQAGIPTSQVIKDIRQAIKDGAKAIVYAGTGNGTIHKDIEAELMVVAKTIPVVRSTKVGDGEVIRNGAVQDDDVGFICSGKLTPDLACLLVQVAMAAGEKDGKTMDTEALRKIFDAYQSSVVAN